MYLIKGGCLHGEAVSWISPTANSPQTATKIDEQRRGFGDACVPAVPAKHLGLSSGSGDHLRRHRRVIAFLIFIET